MSYYQISQISLGPITLQVWGIFVALGFFVATTLAERRCDKKELSEDVLLSLALSMFVGGLIGARLEYVGLFWQQQFAGDILSIFRFWDGGLVSYGGFIGGFLAAVIYLWYRELSFASYIDILASVFPLGYAIGRVGCHLIKDHLGSVTTVPWGVVMPSGEIRHETALYSILAGLLIFIATMLFQKKLARPWYMTLFVGFFYGLTRSVIDIFRARDLPFSDPRYLGLTVGQYLSILLMVVCVIIAVRIHRKDQRRKILQEV